jgi:hypothetical protein
MKLGLRQVSWLLGGASIVLPCAYFVFEMNEFDRYVKAEGGFACGMPILTFGFIAAVAFILLATVAGVVNKRSLRQEVQTISRMRRTESHLFFVPLYCLIVLMIGVGTYYILFPH